MFDSHCHLDASEYDGDRAEVLARAKAAGVRGILVPGWEPREWSSLRALCASDPMLSCAVGVHPWYVHELDDDALERALVELPSVAEQQGAVAIGECGLDAVHAKKHGGASLALQRRVLERHLDVARELSLPVVLHCVHAHGLLLELLESRAPLPRGGVLHSYGGSPELIARYAKLGMCFSFAGIVTRESAKKPRAVLANVPLERLLVESDGPDQAPEDGESHRSEPRDIVRVLEVAASLRSESFDQLAQATLDNAQRLFGRG